MNDVVKKMITENPEAAWKRRIVNDYLIEKGAVITQPALRKQLELLAYGYASAKEAAEASGLAEETVRNYRKRLYKILGTNGKDEVLQHLLKIALGHLKGDKK